MKPTVLISEFLGKITFPHYLKKQDNTTSVEVEVVYSPDDPLSIGSLISIIELQKNTRVFEVSGIWGERKAKGDWSFSKVHPKWGKISATLVGYWNPATETVSKEFITDKKAAA